MVLSPLSTPCITSRFPRVRERLPLQSTWSLLDQLEQKMGPSDDSLVTLCTNLQTEYFGLIPREGGRRSVSDPLSGSPLDPRIVCGSNVTLWLQDIFECLHVYRFVFNVLDPIKYFKQNLRSCLNNLLVWALLCGSLPPITKGHQTIWHLVVK